MATVIPTAGLILERSALATGFAAAAIAVGGFLARSRALLGGASELEIQRYTATGGLAGLYLSLCVILLDAAVG
jgi:hypothetical protein